jgi:crotonobetainyl-CoA:carnitine CoA-transferase CaiB-like acyl-CoA transferase
MLEALAEWMGYPLYFGGYGGNPPLRNGATHPSIAPYGPHRAGDGRDVIFGIQNEREWAAFCREVIARPELAGDDRFANNSRRVEHRADLTQLIEQAFAAASAEQIVDRLDRAGIANGRLNQIGEVLAHAQLKARRRWRQVATEMGPIEALLPPANLEGIQPAMGDVPGLGQHTEAILKELGYEASEIESMRSNGAI